MSKEGGAAGERIARLPPWPEVEFDIGHYEVEAEDLRDMMVYYRERLKLATEYLEQEAQNIEDGGGVADYLREIIAACNGDAPDPASGD